jgi:hypothetical protein
MQDEKDQLDEQIQELLKSKAKENRALLKFIEALREAERKQFSMSKDHRINKIQ